MIRWSSRLGIRRDADMIYLSAAIGLTPGGSGTVHIYTQTIYRTTQIKYITTLRKLNCPESPVKGGEEGEGTMDRKRVAEP